MPRYMVQAQHTPAECLQMLDEMSAQGPEALSQWSFACAAGDHSNHTAYANLEAANESSARQAIPTIARDRVQLTEVGQLTQDQIRSFHQAA